MRKEDYVKTFILKKVLYIGQFLLTIITMLSKRPSRNNPVTKAVRYVEWRLSFHLDLLHQPIPLPINVDSISDNHTATVYERAR